MSEDIVGRKGRVTADIVPGGLGEIVVEVRGGTERFPARASDVTIRIAKHTAVLVTGSLTGRTVEVAPFHS